MKHIAILLALIPLLSACTSVNHQKLAQPYLYDIAINNKAFVVSTKGNVFASWGQSTVDKAVSITYNACINSNVGTCKIYSINGKSVSDYPNYKHMGFTYTDSYLSDIRLIFTCDEIPYSLAVSLYQSGHTYLDKKSDGIPCEDSKGFFLAKRRFSSGVYALDYKLYGLPNPKKVNSKNLKSIFKDSSHSVLKAITVVSPNTVPSKHTVSSPYKIPSYNSSSYKSLLGNCHRVRGYRRKNGTYVHSYVRCYK
ncbi:hypothetical protein F9817_08555 [Vibrio sp. CAIM 722]|uniref:Lipoprotein n=1 Tax=Vibrio eleionomae TaxID=2653505 RepID=A0A7X4RTV9_9VIBR|nr:hypothetical protein [Vibrio eleionomae]MZI93246.1 hypothetical protein [Vibrio eleionomae]